MAEVNKTIIEEIFDVVNELEDDDKRAVLRLGKDLILIRDVRNETTKSKLYSESAC